MYIFCIVKTLELDKDKPRVLGEALELSTSLILPINVPFHLFAEIFYNENRQTSLLI
jgi:hypothetical protein